MATRKHKKISKTPASLADHTSVVQAIHAGALADESTLKGNGDGTYSIAQQGVQALHIADGVLPGVLANAGLQVDANNNWSVKLLSTGGLQFDGSGNVLLKLLAAGGLQLDGGGNLLLKLLATGGLALDGGGNLFARGMQQVGSDSTTSADTWFNTATNSFKGRSNGVTHDFTGKVGYGITLSTAVSNTVTETNFSTTTFPFPAAWFQPGRVLRCRMGFLYGAVSTHTLRIRAKIGGVVILDTGALAMTAATGQRGYADFTIICGAAGVSGNFGGFGDVLIPAFTPPTQPVNSGAVTVNTTGALNFDVSAQWGTASATDTIQVQAFTFEIL